MLASENTGTIFLNKIDGAQVSIEKLDTQQSKKVMGFYQNPLGHMAKQTIGFQKKIQEWNNLLKNSYLPGVMCEHPSS